MQESVAGTAITCVAGLGILDEVHANRLSPRQILITSEAELGELGIPPGALRENMVIAVQDQALFRPGSAILTSSGVEIELTMYCEACARIRSVIPDLNRMFHRRGVLGRIVAGGVLAPGDRLSLVAAKYPSWPDSPLSRFHQFVSLIPTGRVLRYRDVAIGMGVADSFVRAMPGYIRRSVGHGLPLHRIVTATGALPHIVPMQEQLLAAEGVVQRAPDLPGMQSVDLMTYLWQGEPNNH